jgi:hypothetical protein
MIAHLALLAQLTTAVPPVSCQAPSAPALDHAILAVSDLDRVSQSFRSAGFRLKTGRLHPNGLLNRHIKFPDGTEIELMTVRGTAGDDMARRYAKLIAAGDEGAYVALRARELRSVEEQSAALGLDPRRSSSGAWQFLGFAETSSAAAVFFTTGGAAVADVDSIFQHQPRVTALAELWLEGGTALTTLLQRLGSILCGQANGPDDRVGQRWALSGGSIVVVPPRDTARPRVLGAVLEIPGVHSRIVRPTPQFWIQYR